MEGIRMELKKKTSNCFHLLSFLQEQGKMPLNNERAIEKIKEREQGRCIRHCGNSAHSDVQLTRYVNSTE